MDAGYNMDSQGFWSKVVSSAENQSPFVFVLMTLELKPRTWLLGKHSTIELHPNLYLLKGIS